MAAPTPFSFSSAAKERKKAARVQEDEASSVPEMLRIILNEVRSLRAEVKELKTQVQAINEVRATQARVFAPMSKRPGGLAD